MLHFLAYDYLPRQVFDFEIAALAKALKVPVAYFFENAEAHMSLNQE